MWHDIYPSYLYSIDSIYKSTFPKAFNYDTAAENTEQTLLLITNAAWSPGKSLILASRL